MSDVQSGTNPAADEPAVNTPPNNPPDPAQGEPVAGEVGTVQYPDGSSATGVLPLPEKSPTEQDMEDAGAADAAHPATSALDRMEEIAVHWGGDVMAELRKLVAEVRSLL